MFTPAASINTVVNVYMNAIRHEDDAKDNIFTNALIESGFATYEGTERDIKRSFELKHETDKSSIDLLKEIILIYLNNN